ncbi:MAG: acetylglutamate kinase [Rhizobacter sp.]|nr:acetylglutamate kinase [Chlorobiales bacterium]
MKAAPKPVVTSRQMAIEQVLIEALPYIRRFEGTTFVVKYGGAAMTDDALKAKFAQDLTLLRKVGINVVLVHGGGKEITSMAERLGITSEFVQGQRITSEAMMNVVQMTLAGKLNQDIVQLISRQGGRAVGVSGVDDELLRVKPFTLPSGESLGLVGEVEQVNTAFIDLLCKSGIIPVIAPLGTDERGNLYNVNADTAASSIASALGAEKLIYISDVAGVYVDGMILKTVVKENAAEFIEKGVITGGMIPKVLSAFETLDAGVKKVHLVDGTFAHALLLEVFTDDGIGTQFVLKHERDDHYSIND